MKPVYIVARAHDDIIAIAVTMMSSALLKGSSQPPLLIVTTAGERKQSTRHCSEREAVLPASPQDYSCHSYNYGG